MLAVTLGHVSLGTAAPLPWDGAKQGRHITALCAGVRGDLWVGAEDTGVWRWTASAGNGAAGNGAGWKHYTTADGLGDDNGYALACDRQSRIWVGHLNHGVSVFNGEKWRNYDILTGPIGDRVHGLAVGPEGDVWMATSNSLTRYVAAADRWIDYTVADGLPSNQITTVAVDGAGTVFAGTACDGLVIGTPGGIPGGIGVPPMVLPLTWRQVRGPIDRPERAAVLNYPTLPSALVNDVAITPSGAVDVATNYGLARSEDGGRHWSWARGTDWADHVRGRFGGAPKNWKADGPGSLSEDYCTFAREDAAGRLWVGHWRTGVEVFDLARSQRLAQLPTDNTHDYANAILFRPGAAPLLGWYGGGVSEGEGLRAKGEGTAGEGRGAKGEGTAAPAGPQTLAPRPSPSNLPSPAAPPSDAELAVWQQRLEACKDPMQPGDAAYLGEDWQTQGDWVGRYGRARAVLCAQKSPLDDTFGNNFDNDLGGAVGPHRKAGDALRAWVHWLRTDNPKTLYSPILGYRRQSDWDDHGEAYAMSYEGPDVWVRVTAAAGPHRLALYFFNKDGHDGPNRWRDYIVEAKPHFDDLANANDAPTLACHRVAGFWGGVYTQLLVCGPARYCVRINRNGSFNTIVQAAFLDRVGGPLQPCDRQPQLWLAQRPFGPLDDDWQTAAAADEPPAIALGLPVQLLGLWRLVSQAGTRRASAAASRADRITLVRRLAASPAAPDLLQRARWAVPSWTEPERKRFLPAMAELFGALQRRIEEQG